MRVYSIPGSASSMFFLALFGGAVLLFGITFSCFDDSSTIHYPPIIRSLTPGSSTLSFTTTTHYIRLYLMRCDAS